MPVLESKYLFPVSSGKTHNALHVYNTYKWQTRVAETSSAAFKKEINKHTSFHAHYNLK